MRAERMLMRGRALAESLMPTECVIDSDEFTGGVWDEDLLDYTPRVPLPSYEGKCEWMAAGTTPREVDAAGQIVIVQSPELKLPVNGSERVLSGQMGRITANPLDPSLVGTEFRVAGNHSQSFGTTRRFPVEVD